MAALALLGSGFPLVLLILALMLAGALGDIIEAILSSQTPKAEVIPEIEELDKAA